MNCQQPPARHLAALVITILKKPLSYVCIEFNDAFISFIHIGGIVVTAAATCGNTAVLTQSHHCQEMLTHPSPSVKAFDPKS